MDRIRFWRLFWLLTVALGVLLAWFFGNLLYSLFWTELGDRGFSVTEAKLIAYIAAHLVPFLLTLLVGAVLSFLIRREIANAPNSHASTLLRPARYSEKDASLIDTILWIAERSAWGRWQSAQRNGWSNEQAKLTNASSFVIVAAKNGDLAIRGRLRNLVEYKLVDRDFWRRVYIDIQPDPKSLWKAVIARYPGDAIVIPDYDHFLVEWRAIEVTMAQEKLEN